MLGARGFGLALRAFDCGMVPVLVHLRRTAFWAAERVSDYRKLFIWQRARVVATRVNGVVQRLPGVERRRRGDQIVRAAISIRLNIAEGSGRGTAAQFAHHLRIALSSANELEDALQELDDVGLLPSGERELVDESRQLAAMISAFRNRVLHPRANA